MPKTCCTTPTYPDVILLMKPEQLPFELLRTKRIQQQTKIILVQRSVHHKVNLPGASQPLPARHELSLQQH